MLKSYIERFKVGLYLASDSFAMLWHHPTLLIYYLGLIIAYALVFILAYNLIGYQGTCLQFTGEFHAPHNNLLADLIPQTGGLVYLGFIFSIFLNILLRSFLSVALVQHTHALLHGHTPALKEMYIATKNRWAAILNWSLLLGGITLLISALSSLALGLKSIILLTVITSLGIAWPTLTFFVLPILALTRKNISQAAYSSTQLLTAYTPEILGGLFWIGLIYFFTLVTNIAIHEYLMPSGLKDICMEHNFVLFNTLFATILLIFKTRIYHREVPVAQKPEDSVPDYSQF